MFRAKKQPRRTPRSARTLIYRFQRVPRNNAPSLVIPSCSGSWKVPRDAFRPLKRPVGAFLTLGPSGLYVHYIRTVRSCQGVLRHRPGISKTRTSYRCCGSMHPRCSQYDKRVLVICMGRTILGLSLDGGASWLSVPIEHLTGLRDLAVGIVVQYRHLGDHA